MRAYRATFSAKFRALLQYRAAAAAGLATQAFFGLLRIMIFTAFYASASGPQPMTLPDVVTYVWLSQGLLMLLPWRPDADVEQLIRNGNVAYELLRPVDLYGLWFSRALAVRTAPVLLRCVPMFVIAALWFDMGAPASVASGLAFTVSLIATAALAAALTTLLSISILVTISGRGVHVLTISVVNLFSGVIVPLPLLPDWIQPLVAFLPFRGLLDTPFRLYLGHLPPSAIWVAVGHQVLWTAMLVLAGRMILSRALRRIVVQGG
ncbi:MAG: ABC-2 family transporter protein [Myxococcota bacterium]